MLCDNLEFSFCCDFNLTFLLNLSLTLTFPKVILRSKKLSYFCPLLDCIYAPYKDHWCLWFGMRIIVLICISGLESWLVIKSTVAVRSDSNTIVCSDASLHSSIQKHIK